MPTALQAQWSSSGSTVYYTGGQVCVGTSAPSWSKFVVAQTDGGSQAQIAAEAGGTGQGQRAVYSFFPTFEGTSDNGPRRAADIVGGFNGCPWGCEYLSFNVGSGGSANDVGALTHEWMRITSAGNVGIGTTAPQYRLSVNGTVQAKEVIVNTGWSDYVFDPGYKLMPLPRVAAYIKQHHHLPGVPTAAEVEKNGVKLAEMQATLLAKVEELTLQVIQLQQEVTTLKHRSTK